MCRGRILGKDTGGVCGAEVPLPAHPDTSPAPPPARAGSGVNAQPRAGPCFLKHLLLPPEGPGRAAKMLCLDGKSPPAPLREENLSGRGIRERGGGWPDPRGGGGGWLKSWKIHRTPSGGCSGMWGWGMGFDRGKGSLSPQPWAHSPLIPGLTGPFSSRLSALHRAQTFLLHPKS